MRKIFNGKKKLYIDFYYLQLNFLYGDYQSETSRNDSESRVDIESAK